MRATVDKPPFDANGTRTACPPEREGGLTSRVGESAKVARRSPEGGRKRKLSEARRDSGAQQGWQLVSWRLEASSSLQLNILQTVVFPTTKSVDARASGRRRTNTHAVCKGLSRAGIRGSGLGARKSNLPNPELRVPRPG